MACAFHHQGYASFVELTFEIYAFLFIAATLAGFIDSIAGGGGLITVPAMLAVGIPPVNVLATNKMQSISGTGTSCYRYAKAGLIDFRSYRWTLAWIFIAASAGTILIQLVSTDILGWLVPILLSLVVAYVLFSPRMTDDDAHERLSVKGYGPVAGLIGFYDGFFGPGTGSFFTTTLVGLRGIGLTRATGLTKAFNFTSNAASVIFYALGGKMLWTLGLLMAIGSIGGAWLGTHMAMRFGARVIRPFLILISLGLIVRLLWQQFG